MVGIIDIGLSNISSVQNMVKKCGGEAEFIRCPEQLEPFKKVILPGVGNFKTGIKRLHETGIGPRLVESVKNEGVGVLGICLGMQLLCLRSEEGNQNGLGLVDAYVDKFDFQQSQKLKIPHMGWNVVEPTIPNILIPQQREEQRFYFVHSYKVVPNNPSMVIATSFYGEKFCAAFRVGKIFGVQFHPEKSHRFGKMLMKRFLES